MDQTAYVDLHPKRCRRKHRAPSHELLHIVDSKLQCAGNRFVTRGANKHDENQVGLLLFSSHDSLISNRLLMNERRHRVRDYHFLMKQLDECGNNLIKRIQSRDECMTERPGQLDALLSISYP